MNKFEKALVKLLILGAGSVIGFVIFLALVFSETFGHFFSFNARGKYLSFQVVGAIYRGDVDHAKKVLSKYEKWENALNLIEKRRYIEGYKYWKENYGVRYPFLMKQCNAGKFYPALLCETERDWDGALTYLKEYEYLTYAKSVERIVYFDCYCKRIDLKTTQARIFYKKGELEQAFIAYCKVALLEEFSHNLDRPEYVKCFFCQEGTRSASRRMSPFPTYPDFLRFMEEEYAKLGSPEEYREAMEIYRALGEGE